LRRCPDLEISVQKDVPRNQIFVEMLPFIEISGDQNASSPLDTLMALGNVDDK
jgi:hypothetical protein